MDRVRTANTFTEKQVAPLECGAVTLLCLWLSLPKTAKGKAALQRRTPKSQWLTIKSCRFNSDHSTSWYPSSRDAACRRCASERSTSALVG